MIDESDFFDQSDTTMKQTRPPLEIAKPCSMDWNAMAGDERKRFCAGCQKHVFNLSAMTQGEARKFADETQGRECIAYVQADEGSIHTPNVLERGLLWLSHRLPRMAALVTVMLPAALVSCSERRMQGEPMLKGKTRVRVEQSLHQSSKPEKNTPPPYPVVPGMPALPPPPPEKPIVLGKVAPKKDPEKAPEKPVEKK